METIRLLYLGVLLTALAHAGRADEDPFAATKALLANCDSVDPTDPDPTFVEAKPVSPFYPDSPGDRSKSAFVCVEATITLDGSVKEPKVLLTDNPRFARKMLLALRRAKYVPAMRNGVLVEEKTVIRASYSK